MSRRIVMAGIASGLAGLLPLTALAQAAAAAAAPASAPDSGEIAHVIVTAQKRKEDIRDVPLSVSVLSAEQLKADQITSVEDITRNVPNVSFTSQGGPGLGTIEIRGVSSQAGSATVSTYLDDVSLTTRNLYSQGTAEPRYFDLDSIEVLRGPQGTLYGASSLGGTLKITSHAPDLRQYGGYVETSVSGTEHGGLNYDMQGVLNIPLVPGQVALRLGVERGHESGYIDLVDQNTLQTVSKGINSDTYTVFKAALRANLGQGWSITPALFAQTEDTADISAAYLTTQGGTPLPLFETSKTVREPGRDRLIVPSVTLSGDTGFGSFTGVLSGYIRRFDRVQDGTVVNDPAFAINDPVTYAGLVNALDNLSSAVLLGNTINQTSLEMRLASKDYDPATGNPFTWIGGVYLQGAETQVYDTEPIYGVDATFAQYNFDPGNPALLSGGYPGDFANDISYYSARHYHDQQGSAFGEGTWHFSPVLSFTAGLRQIYASQHFTREGAYFYAGDPPPPDALINASWSATTPSFKLNWQASRDLSLYANISKGFRLGGANRPIPNTQLTQEDYQNEGIAGAPASFAPDSLWSYEVGEKGDFLDRSLSVNLSVFYLDWKNIQQDVTLPLSGYDFETNTGNATSYGFETDLTARVSAHLSLKAGAGLTHATFAEDVPLLGINSNTGQPWVQKGDWIEGVPRASASLGADYHWEINDAVGAFVRGNGQWTGKSHGSLFSSSPDYVRPDYVKFDASTGANWESWEVTLFVRNLTNNHTVLQQPSIQSVTEAYYLRPRTIGATVNYEF